MAAAIAIPARAANNGCSIAPCCTRPLGARPSIRSPSWIGGFSLTSETALNFERTADIFLADDTVLRYLIDRQKAGNLAAS